MKPIWPGLVLVAALPFAPLPAGEAKKTAGRPSPEAVKALKVAVPLLGGKDHMKGLDQLEEIARKWPDDPAAAKAKELLLENGAGGEIRTILESREIFRDRFRIPERSVLEQGEKTLKTLREWYKGLKTPWFKQSKLILHFYDSPATFRKKGGAVTAAGHFATVKADHKRRTLDGKIEWYFPQEAGSPKDRQTFMAGLLYHEMTHYLNAIQFGYALPAILDEGLATWFTSRQNTEPYQAFRTTDRQRLESNARNALNTIARYEDFLAMLASARGFDQGNVMLNRWYGLCYAIIDFMVESGLGGKKTPVEKILEALDRIIDKALEGSEGGEKRAEVPVLKNVLEALVKELYGEKLETFHKELLKYIQARYKQQY